MFQPQRRRKQTKRTPSTQKTRGGPSELTASRLTKSSRQSRTCLAVWRSSVVCRPGGGRFSGCSEEEEEELRCGGWSHGAPLRPGEEDADRVEVFILLGVTPWFYLYDPQYPW